MKEIAKFGPTDKHGAQSGVFRMGEASRKRIKKLSDIPKSEERCIYCRNRPDSVEHMPPLVIFKDSYRPSGMEFASCTACNTGTSSADLIAGFICRIRMEGSATDWQLTESNEQLTMIGKRAPDFIVEFFNSAKHEKVFRRGTSGLLRPAVQIHADGPVTKAYLSTFASKFGMALFRKEVGIPLPLHGRVFSQWFMNSGLSQKTADAILAILPEHSTLSQGKWRVDDQFSYRFNSDERTIVAGLASFQSGLFVHIIGTSEPEKYPFFTRLGMTGGPTDAIAGPGDLLKMMPQRRDAWLLRG